MEVTKSVDDSVFFKPKKNTSEAITATPSPQKNPAKYLMTD